MKFVPWLVLAADLLGTYGLKQWAVQSAHKDLGIKFEKQATELVRQLEQRLDVQMLVLRGTSGLISSSVHVTPEEFHDYIASLKLQKTNPGVLGIGFALALPTKHGEQGLRFWLRNTNKRDAIFTKYFGNQQSALLYVEPHSERLQSVIGHDMYADPERRAAMDLARDLQQSTMTGKIQLLGDMGGTKASTIS